MARSPYSPCCLRWFIGMATWFQPACADHLRWRWFSAHAGSTSWRVVQRSGAPICGRTPPFLGPDQRPTSGQGPLGFVVGPRRFSGRKSRPVSGQKILPIFWARNPAQFPGGKSCPVSGREILPIFWSENLVRLLKRIVFFTRAQISCSFSGREILPIFWARNPAHFLGAKSCPFSGREIAPTSH